MPIHGDLGSAGLEPGRYVQLVVRDTGAYRLEALLSIDGEERPWIFTNPIFVGLPSDLTLPAAPASSNVDVQAGVAYTDGAPADADKHKLDLALALGADHVIVADEESIIEESPLIQEEAPVETPNVPDPPWVEEMFAEAEADAERTRTAEVETLEEEPVADEP